MSKFIPTFILSLILLMSSFSKKSNAQSWSFASSYNGEGRHHPITFSNDRYGFVIAGQNEFGEYLEDVHRYDSHTNSWEQLDNFPGGPRGFAYGVSNNQYAFVGFGSYGSSFPVDWWRYDIENDEWNALADFPSGGRNHPALIITGDKIYMGLGSNQINLGDWWQYDIELNVWTEKAEFEFGDRHHPFYFAINGIPYVGFGHGNDIYNDFYKYDEQQNSWITLNNFPDEARVAGTQFSLNGKGYVLSGDGDDHGPLDSGEFWEYEPNTDSWQELNSHPGGARWAPGCFVINCDVFLTSGHEQESDTYHNDLVKYETGLECGCNDSTALNFNPETDINDGSCEYCESNLLYVIINQNNITDSLNWSIAINGEQSILATGGSGTTNICLENNCYDFIINSSLELWSGVNYQITDTNGNIFANGTIQNNLLIDTIEVGEMECYIESYRCNDQQDCINPMDGSGEYSSLSECQDNCIAANIDSHSNSIKISPNPSKGMIKIHLNDKIQNLHFKVFNML
jgi:N-acetylneuraminic acid mutarotase